HHRLLTHRDQHALRLGLELDIVPLEERGHELRQGVLTRGHEALVALDAGPLHPLEQADVAGDLVGVADAVELASLVELEHGAGAGGCPACCAKVARDMPSTDAAARTWKLLLGKSVRTIDSCWLNQYG